MSVLRNLSIAAGLATVLVSPIAIRADDATVKEAHQAVTAILAADPGQQSFLDGANTARARGRAWESCASRTFCSSVMQT